jgi:hypothetical protein
MIGVGLIVVSVFFILAAFGIGIGLVVLLDQAFDGKIMGWLEDSSSALKNIAAALVIIICVAIGFMAVEAFGNLLNF